MTETKNQEINKGSIHIFGTGIKAISQITLESNYLLQKMDQVFHVSSNPKISEYLVSIGCKEINLSELYTVGKKRKEVYQNICDKIILAANSNIKCAFLTQGNPIFLDTIVKKIDEAAILNNIPISIYPGVSSIDTILNDLRLPAGLTGLQCFECTHFIRIQPRFDTRVPLLLFQPGVIEDFEIRKKIEGNLEGIQILKTILLKNYSPQQNWFLVNSSGSSETFGVFASGRLENMEQKANLFNRGTLLIPGEWSFNYNKN